jgi:CRISPR system Cascade subunit CasD
MGDLAVGERRPTAQRPARSAVLGLVGAALGVERAAAEAQTALQSGYGVATRTLHVGELLTDYHTAQVPAARKGKRKGERWPTRRAELAEPKLNTILSDREYREEPAFTVALWARPEGPWTLAEIAAALRAPRFTLFMGRKACPLGLPPRPVLLEAVDLAAAFAAYDRSVRKSPAAAKLQDWLGLKILDPAPLHADRDRAMPLGAEVRSVLRRRDLARDRRVWTFEQREELVASMPRRAAADETGGGAVS